MFAPPRCTFPRPFCKCWHACSHWAGQAHRAKRRSTPRFEHSAPTFNPQPTTLNLSVHHFAQILSSRSRSATGLTTAINSRISSFAFFPADSALTVVSVFSVSAFHSQGPITDCSAWRKS